MSPRSARRSNTRALVICNSKRTADDVVKLAGVARDRTRVVYYGIDPVRFGAVEAAEREASARGRSACRPTRRLALFVGALGDRRKGFDTVFDAWRTLCGRTGLGRRSRRRRHRRRARRRGKRASARELPEGRMRFLGFRRDMPAVFAACDLLIHPARYEAYGLAVHEALCRGPAGDR